MGSVTSYCSVDWRGRDWGQGDGLRGHHSCPDGTGEPQGCGNRDGEKGMSLGFKAESTGLGDRRVEKQGIMLFPF